MNILQNNEHILKHIKVGKDKEQLWIFPRLKDTKEIQQPSATWIIFLAWIILLLRTFWGQFAKLELGSLNKGYMGFIFTLQFL